LNATSDIKIKISKDVILSANFYEHKTFLLEEKHIHIYTNVRRLRFKTGYVPQNRKVARNNVECAIFP